MASDDRASWAKEAALKSYEKARRNLAADDPARIMYAALVEIAGAPAFFDETKAVTRIAAEALKRIASS